MSEAARDTFEGMAKDAYDLAKDEAKAIKDEAKDYRDTFEDDSAEWIAADEAYEARKQEYEKIRDADLDEWLQAVYEEMQASGSDETGSSNSDSGDGVDGSSDTGTSSSSDGSSGIGYGSGGGTPVDQSAVRIEFSVEIKPTSIDHERERTMAFQARERASNLAETIGTSSNAVTTGQSMGFANALVSLYGGSETTTGQLDMRA